MTIATRLSHRLALGLALALVAGTALHGLSGCGDNRDCVGDQCDLAFSEVCGVAGDEDGNGLADCDDPVCTADPACQPQCGNGIQNIGEACDDSNTVDTDDCTNTCNRARCGDGIVHAGAEQCDDGNTVNTDACTNACHTPTCGDGIVSAGEQCDDANQVNTDACTNTCHNARCGDTIVGPGEECDDGNQNNNDGCTNDCHAGFCGDGMVNPGEECDDANQSNTDACTNSCHNAACGDTFVGPGEMCDDGNQDNTDGCTTLCRLPGCGDGFMQAGEQCDDGNMVDTDGCLHTCMTATCGDLAVHAGVEECDDGNADDSDACLHTCVAAICGDMIVHTGVEQCDDGNNVDTDACTNACTTARCGDGFMQAGEACDDGNNVDTDGCTNACTVARCGDGITGPNETCDDTNMAGGDGCSAACAVESGYACNMSPSVCTTVCGDGIIVGGERCDQGGGNVANGDGCSATCQLEPGFVCVGAPTVCAATCGNGVLDPGEQCDDTNRIPGDGCSANCQIDIGCGPGETQVSATNAMAFPIPDNMETAVPPVLALSPVVFQSNQVVGKVAVVINNITHTYDSDLDIALASPRLVVRNLSLGRGSNGDNYVGTFFDDTAATAISAGAAPFTGRFRPEQSFGGPGGYRGQAAGGMWTLAIGDHGVGDTGTLNSWTLIACTSLAIPVCGNGNVDPGEECDDGNQVNGDACSNACQIMDGCGDGNIDAGETCDDDNIVSGDGCSAMCQVDIGCPVGQVAVSVTNNTASPIPDNDPVTGISSQVAVADAGGVTSAKVFIKSLTHTYDGDVDMYLVSPSGTQRELSTGNGSSGHNFTNTLFDDGAATAVTAGVAPFSGSFRPEQSLTANQSVDFKRLSAAGNWTLKVFDHSTGDTGTLNSWTLLMCVDPTARCGDGMVNGGDECDDGNNVNNDNCSNTCAIVDGCGDGNIDNGEACDDNNAVSGDGCSATCQPDIGCAAGQTAVVVTNPNATPIPDNVNGLVSTINVPTGGIVRRVITTLNITHAQDPHLDIFLMSPAGGRRELSTDQAGANYVSTILSDSAPLFINAGSAAGAAAPYTGAFKPETPLAPFNNQAAGGDWLLHIGDDTAATTGTLNSWTLALCVDTFATRICGNGYVEGVEQCDDGNVAAGDGCSPTCQVEVSCAVGQSLVFVTSADAKAVVPDNLAAGVLSTIPVVGAGTVAKAVVVINDISHTYDTDLDISLISPLATTLDLSSDNGDVNDDYFSTILADSATTPIAGSTAAPFRGLWKPEQALSGVNGQPAAGVWTLKVADDLGGDLGILRTWSIGLCVAPVP